MPYVVSDCYSVGHRQSFLIQLEKQQNALFLGRQHQFSVISLLHLMLCVPFIITYYVNGPTRCNFYIFIYSTIFISTLHFSNDRIVHHQEFVVVYCITQLCAIVQMCSPAAGHIRIFFVRLPNLLRLWAVLLIKGFPLTEGEIQNIATAHIPIKHL